MLYCFIDIPCGLWAFVHPAHPFTHQVPQEFRLERSVLWSQWFVDSLEPRWAKTISTHLPVHCHLACIPSLPHWLEQCASAGHWARVISMGRMYSATRPLMPLHFFVNLIGIASNAISHYFCPPRTGWWFGTWLLLFQILLFQILGISSSQLTNIFQRGSNHQPAYVWLHRTAMNSHEQPIHWEKGHRCRSHWAVQLDQTVAIWGDSVRLSCAICLLLLNMLCVFLTWWWVSCLRWFSYW